MKKVKRIKIKFKNVFIFLIVILGIGLIGYFLLNKKINNIYIIGNEIIEEQDILELIDFNEYLKYYQISPKKIENRLKTNLIIEEANVKKSLFSIKINIKEEKILWYQEDSSSVMLSSGKMVTLDKKVLGIPSLINQIDSVYIKEFIDELSKIDDDVFCKISEISYAPSELDKERFLLYMNDTNYVYVNISRMNYLNKYDELLPKLENKKGILYLDSGNHFEIKDKK